MVWAIGSGDWWPGIVQALIPGTHPRAQSPFCVSQWNPLVGLAPVKAVGWHQLAVGWALSSRGCRFLRLQVSEAALAPKS